ncbi:nucleotidyltransferase domain-containing protein [Ignavibacteriales bacterium]
MTEDIQKIVEEYSKKILSIYDVRYIVLFGSYQRGNFREDSDIDIAIIVDKFSDDFLEDQTNLFRLTRGIDSRIEPVLLSLTEDQSGFVESIVKNSKILYAA